MKFLTFILVCLSCFAKLKIPEEIKKKYSSFDQQLFVYYVSLVNLFKSCYFKQFSDEEFLEKAVKGFLSEFDNYTTFIDEKTLSLLAEHTDGEFGGIGVEIIPFDGFIKILHPIEKSPAFKSGIRPGDVITHIDGKFIYKEFYDLIVKKLRGKPGSKVVLTIKRRYKEPFNVTIKRETIKIPFVKHDFYLLVNFYSYYVYYYTSYAV